MPPPRKGIKYHIASEAGRKKQQEMADNPMLSTFVPLTERTEIDKARWWARFGKKARDKKYYGEFD